MAQGRRGRWSGGTGLAVGAGSTMSAGGTSAFERSGPGTADLGAQLMAVSVKVTGTAQVAGKGGRSRC